MAHHHDSQAISDASLRQLAETVQAGGRCADVFIDAQPTAAIADMRKLCFDFFKMDEHDCDLLMNDVDARAREVAPLFEIPITNTPGYDQILRIAAEAMARVTSEANDGSAGSEKVAAAGAIATGSAGQNGPRTLADRASFDKRLAAHLAAAVSQGSPLSVVLIEIDHLKALESEQGRSAGERVLQTVGRLLGAISRPQDHPARLDSERLVLLMPGATRALAAASAEAVRRTLAARPVVCGNGLVVPVTLSAGVATYEPGIPLREPAHLMKAAELAVFAARQSGRNCVRVFTLPKVRPQAVAA
jgi:diguanylate cyclase (GGDEF)-like protein